MDCAQAPGRSAASGQPGSFQERDVADRSAAGHARCFRGWPQLLDREIAFWTIQPGEEVAPRLDDGPAMPLGPMPVPGGPPPGFGMPGGRGPRGFGEPGRRKAADPNYQFQKFSAEHGDRSVTILFSGIPANSDPSRGDRTRRLGSGSQATTRAGPGRDQLHVDEQRWQVGPGPLTRRRCRRAGQAN